MAHLLGSQFCIDSLRSDVSDLQFTITEVFSRAGPVSFPSWKYPDKKMDEVDVDEILELYNYSEDEEERQVAHIVLLEMVIDRMVLLIQSSAKFLDQVTSVGNQTSLPAQTHNTSIGLVVRKYWNKSVQLQTMVKHLQSENKTKSRKIADLENTIKKLNEELECCGNNEADNSSIKSASSMGGSRISSAQTVRSVKKSALNISKDEYNKSTQTVETCFVPCESCERVQKSMKEVGHNVMAMCQSQKLPSSLAKFTIQVADLDWFSANDVARWSCEQSKDMNRINKHLEYLMSTIEPLKENLQGEKNKGKELQSKMANTTKDLKLERETSSAQVKMYENKMKQTEAENQESLRVVKRECTDVEEKRSILEKQVQLIKTELGNQKDLVQELEKQKNQLAADIDERIANSEDVKNLKLNIGELTSQLTEVKSELDSTKTELNKEKARNKNANKHSESIQSKQEGLVQRLDELDQENEELRNQVAELEDEREELTGAIEKLEDKKRTSEEKYKDEKKLIKEISEEKETLEDNISSLEQTVKQMEQKLQEAKDRERLIIEYPDLNGPVNPDVAGTGDIAADMENQVQANEIRIKVLEDQNKGLRNSITKVIKAQTMAKKKTFQSSQPLWNQNTSQVESNVEMKNYSQEKKTSEKQTKSMSHVQYYDSPSSEENDALSRRPKSVSRSSVGKVSNGRQSKKQDTFVVERGQSAKKKSQVGTNLHSVHTSESSVGAYRKLKDSGLLKQKEVSVGKRRSQSRISQGETSETDYRPQDTFTCVRCDKIYNSERDLEVHRSYCYGGI